MTETVDRSSTDGTVDEPDESFSSSGGSLADVLPTDRLMDAVKTLVGTVADRALDVALERVDGLTGRLNDVTANGGSGLASALSGGGSDDDDDDSDDEGGGIGGALKSGLSTVKDKVTGALGFGGGDDDEDADGSGGGSGGGGGGSRGKFKFMNVFEAQDVGVPIRVAYDQWTQFADFPSFMKKVESVNQESDEKSVWTAKVFWSRRSWDTTIREQIPDSHIIWVSSGAKGYADGCVTFHELAPNMTRIILILEYYPQGFMEKTGNLWRAVGRRARLEFKHFCRHVMMDTLINRDELEGWRGTIRDSEVVTTHEEALQEEQEAAEDEDAADSDVEDVEDVDDLADDDLEDGDLEDGDELADDELADEEVPEDELDGDVYDEDDEDLPDDVEDADGPDDVEEPVDADEVDDEVDDTDEEPPPRARRSRRKQGAPA